MPSNTRQFRPCKGCQETRALTGAVRKLDVPQRRVGREAGHVMWSALIGSANPTSSAAGTQGQRGERGKHCAVRHSSSLVLFKLGRPVSSGSMESRLARRTRQSATRWQKQGDTFFWPVISGGREDVAWTWRRRGVVRREPRRVFVAREQLRHSRCLSCRRSRPHSLQVRVEAEVLTRDLCAQLDDDWLRRCLR